MARKRYATEAIIGHLRTRQVGRIVSQVTMKIHCFLSLIGLVTLTASPIQAETSLYELALKGKQCQEGHAQILGCGY
jgi:hypothetical protein